MLGSGGDEAIGPTVVSSDDENTLGGKGVEGRSRDSRPLRLRQESRAWCQYTEMVRLPNTGKVFLFN